MVQIKNWTNLAERLVFREATPGLKALSLTGAGICSGVFFLCTKKLFLLGEKAHLTIENSDSEEGSGESDSLSTSFLTAFLVALAVSFFQTDLAHFLFELTF